MLLPAYLSALALTAPTPRPWACELAPSFGQGSSDEGHIDAITTLGFACRYELIQILGVSASPVLGLDKQLWSVNTTNNGRKDISSYETQDFHFGLRLHSALSSRSKVFYTVAGGQGRGTLETTASTESSSVSGNYANLRQTFLSQTLGVAYSLTERLDLSLAWQRQDAKQSWDADPSDLFVQSVSDTNAMTLTDGNSTSLVGTSLRTKNQHTTNAIQIGLSVSFGG